METYSVKGMSCAACSARVEKAVLKVSGVDSCSVSLLTNSMTVTGTASPADITAAVKNAGYKASLKKNNTNGNEKHSDSEDDLKDMETPVLVKRLVVSAVFLAVLMYISMGHMMWGWKVPPFFQENHIAMGLMQLLLTVVIMVINQKFLMTLY